VDHAKVRLVMMCVQDKEALKMIAVWVGMLVCLFVTGCRDKSAAAVDHCERGEAHYFDGEYDQAFSELTKAIDLDPGLTRAYVTRGMAYNDKDKYDLAIADFTKVIEIKPTDARAYVDRGMAYKNNGEYDLAVADYSKAIEIEPMVTDAYRGRAGAYYYKGEYDKAWKDVYEAQALGHQIDSKLLEKLREASGRDE
jgi:tetratricopeptide (TPR) repeat protein